MKKQGKMRNLILSEQFRNIAIYIAIFLFYVLYFGIICNSGLSADDMWNSNIQAARYLNGPSAWEVMGNQMSTWLKLGRVFPFSNYAAILFAGISSVPVYKACIVGMIVINALVCGTCIKCMTRSKHIELVFLLVFPLFLQLTPEFDSGLYCYHMLIQMVVLWCFLSLWSLLRYMECGKRSYAVGSACFFFLALGTYEVAFVFIIALIWAAIAMQKDWKSAMNACLPVSIVFAVMGLANLWARLFLQEGAYQGITVSLSVKEVWITLLKQCSTCFPVGRYICSGLKYCEPYSNVYPYSLSGIWSWIRVGDILVLLLFLCLFLVAAGGWKQKNLSSADGQADENEAGGAKRKPEWGLIGLGLIVFLLPGILIAVSAKYQQILGWCSGHLPAYMQSVGLAVAVTGVYALIQRSAWKRQVKLICSGGSLCIAIIIILLNLVSGRAGVEYMNGFRKYPQENISYAAEAGFFDEVSGDSSKVVFGTTAYIYDQSCTGEFYSKLVKSHIYAVTRGELVNQCIAAKGMQQEYLLSELQGPEYYGVFNMAERDSGAIIMGKCVRVELNETGTDFQHVWLENPQVFLRSSEEIVIPADWRLVKSGSDYAIYILEGMYDVMQDAEYYNNEAGTGVLYQK